MVYGAILEKGQEWYTDLNMVFQALGNVQLDYNWLVTDWECSQSVDEFQDECCWMTGKELTQVMHRHPNLQWIWGVFSGFDKRILKEQVMEYPLPYAVDYDGFWKNPVSIQHPLASVEIVPWDSSAVLVISRDMEVTGTFRKSMPFSEDLCEYNAQKLRGLEV